VQLIDSMRGEAGKFGQWALSFSLSSLPILVFFFLKDREQIGQWFRSYLPRERSLVTQVAQEMNQQIAN